MSREDREELRMHASAIGEASRNAPLEPPSSHTDVCPPHGLERPLEHDLGTSDRLAKVSPRITYVIHLWLDDAIGHKVIGPFTLAEVKRIQDTLTCKHHTERITTDVPTWATRKPVPTMFSDGGAAV